MSKKYIAFSVMLAMLVSIFLGIVMPQELYYKHDNIAVKVNMRTDVDTQVKFYYLENASQEFSEERCVVSNIGANSEFQTLEFLLPVKHVEGIRIDCDINVSTWDIKSVIFDLSEKEVIYEAIDLADFDKNDISDSSVDNNYITLKAGDVDPFIVGHDVLESVKDTSINYMYLAVIISFIFVLLVLLMNRNVLCSMARGVFGAKKQIILLSINDFKSRFTGSYLGVVWGVIQPLMTILLFWFVFQVGFRAAPMSDAPFILWLVAGMIPWNFFSDAWLSGNGSFTGYSFIVKKVVFNVEILPLIKVCASFILNIIFNALIIVIYTLYGRFPGLHLVDMIYYSVCLAALAWGLSMITATLTVFIKDIGQFLGVIMQFLMWLTPIMWDYQIIPQKLSWMYKCNPLFYIINGYRESLIDGKWFFSNFYGMVWFWVCTILVIVIGMKLMKKMRPHFADVL